MEQTDDIDIMLTLNPHGWSTCFIFVRDVTLDITITHVFGNLFFDLIYALSALIRGQDSVSFIWYSEPGGHKFEINRNMTQQHKVIVSISEFGEAFHEEPKSFDLKLDFEIKLKQLIIIFYFQLQKTHLLLQDRQFAKDRVKDFPFQEFHQFDRLAKPYINL